MIAAAPSSTVHKNPTLPTDISHPENGGEVAGPTEQVLSIVKQLAGAMNTAINEIREINDNAKLLSLNAARIEAARAGSSGAAFGVVAQEMQGLSNKTASVADQMANKTQESISNLVGIIGGNVRGTRLTRHRAQ